MKMHMSMVLVGISVAGLLASVAGMGRQPQPVEKAAVPAAATADAPEVAALAFLRGTWRGEMEGDPVEETWSAPSGDSIIGMFRWQHEGKTTLWEMLSVKAEGGAAVLRLRHFGGDFSPWRGECDGVAAMKATTVEKARVVFTNEGTIGGVASCEYACPNADELVVVVSFKAETGREALRFTLKRAKE